MYNSVFLPIVFIHVTEKRRSLNTFMTPPEVAPQMCLFSPDGEGEIHCFRQPILRAMAANPELRAYIPEEIVELICNGDADLQSFYCPAFNDLLTKGRQSRYHHGRLP